MSFTEGFNSSNVYVDGNLAIMSLHINQLIRNKKASGRLKDLADAETLEKILKKRKKK